MQRISIEAIAPSLPTSIVEQLNQQHKILVNTIGIEFAETGFFSNTGFEQLEIVQELSADSVHKLDFFEESQGSFLKVLSKIPSADFDTTQVSYGYEYAKLEAVKVLIAILERFNLDARPFKIRAFHIQGAVSRSKIQETLVDMDSADQRDLQINFKMEYEFATARFDFLAFEFTDTIERILEKNSLGEVEGNEIGQGYFTLFCVGDNPRLMLDSIKDYLLECTISSEDFVLIVDEIGEEKVWMRSLKDWRHV